MALLNRQLKWKTADKIPLVEQENKIIVRPEDEDEENVETFTQRSISIWMYDAVFILVEHLQYYALLLALAQRWGWPLVWIKATHFTFLANFDIWEFWNVESGAYNRSTTAFVDTNKLGFNYSSYFASWGTLISIVAIIFIGFYAILARKRPLYLLLHIARLKRILYIVVQLTALPFGIAAARVFHCRADASNKIVMDVDNSQECYTSIHIIWMAVVIVAFLLLFIVYALIIALIIKEQVFCNTRRTHEGYLQLKEAEYEQGLDILWYVGQFHLFSSYRRFWVYYNPLKLLFKMLIIVAYACSMSYIFYATSAISVLFLIAFLAILIKQPFRVKAFNFMLAINLLCLSANALIGDFMEMPPWENANTFVIVSFLRYPTIMHILIGLNGFWVVVFCLWVLYLVLRERTIIGRTSLWPRLSYDSSNDVGEDTKKYLKAVLRGRHTLEQALSTLPLFSPVHELSRQIQIINAFSREAEFISDPTHDTLWDLLDELIEAHNHLSPVSLFGSATTNKQSIRETAKEFLKLMPSFSKRLAQREYDLSLVSPVKRRLLLKMYALGVFVNGRKSRRRQREEVSKKVEDALKRHQDQEFGIHDFQTESGYSASESNIFYNSRPTTSGTLDDFDGRQSTTSVAGFLEQIENWTRTHPRPDTAQSSSNGKSSRPGTALSLKHYKEDSLSSISLPGQVATDEDLKQHQQQQNGKSDTDTITTRTSGYTSGIVHDSDSDSFKRQQRNEPL
eukprot:gene7985-8842_t